MAQQRLFGMQAGDVVLQYSSFCFDASVLEHAMALSAGARLVLAPRERLLPGPELIRLIEEEEVSAAILTCPVCAPCRTQSCHRCAPSLPEGKPPALTWCADGLDGAGF